MLSVLLIIGGDIVQQALAQTTGFYYAPVCFSFGWVAYSFSALVGVIGDGRLLPPPDYQVKVFNLKNGYMREGKNWLVGRLLRDNEMFISKSNPLGNGAIRISVYEALPRKSGLAGPFIRMRIFAGLVMLLQLGTSAIPVVRNGDWGVMLVTGVGTLLALLAGLLPQWRVEQLPTNQKSEKDIALTCGNGSLDIMIVRGMGEGFDLEELAAPRSPRLSRSWQSFPMSTPSETETDNEKNGNRVLPRLDALRLGFPIEFWITRLVCTVQSVCWFGLLITVAGLRSASWYLLIVGGLGMFQNAAVAAVARSPEKRGLPLLLRDAIVSQKVMDGLMDLEVAFPGWGRQLLAEFFPGNLFPHEIAWWTGDTKAYDKLRRAAKNRGFPRSEMPRYPPTTSTTSYPSVSGKGRRVSSFAIGRRDSAFQFPSRENSVDEFRGFQPIGCDQDDHDSASRLTSPPFAQRTEATLTRGKELKPMGLGEHGYQKERPDALVPSLAVDAEQTKSESSGLMSQNELYYSVPKRAEPPPDRSAEYVEGTEVKGKRPENKLWGGL